MQFQNRLFKRASLYVGTTDGAVWMTKNGGQKWDAVYQQKEEKKEDDKKQAEKKDDGESKQKPESNDKPETQESPSDADEFAAINGTWSGELISDRFPQGQAPGITLVLKSDNQGKISGEIETRRGSSEITEGTYDPQTGALSVIVETRRGRREFKATAKGTSMQGEMSMRDGQFTIEFEADKQKDPDKNDPAAWVLAALSSRSILTSAVAFDDDPMTGTWSCRVQSDQLSGLEK